MPPVAQRARGARTARGRVMAHVVSVEHARSVDVVQAPAAEGPFAAYRLLARIWKDLVVAVALHAHRPVLHQCAPTLGKDRAWRVAKVGPERTARRAALKARVECPPLVVPVLAVVWQRRHRRRHREHRRRERGAHAHAECALMPSLASLSLAIFGSRDCGECDAMAGAAPRRHAARARAALLSRASQGVLLGKHRLGSRPNFHAHVRAAPTRRSRCPLTRGAARAGSS